MFETQIADWFGGGVQLHQIMFGDSQLDFVFNANSDAQRVQIGKFLLQITFKRLHLILLRSGTPPGMMACCPQTRLRLKNERDTGFAAKTPYTSFKRQPPYE